MKNLNTLILRNSLLLFATLFTISSLQTNAQTTAQSTPQAVAPTTPQTAAPAPIKPVARVTQAIDENNLVPLNAKVHPLAKAEFDRGVVADSVAVSRMLIILQRSPEQEVALRTLLDEQQSKGSPNYHAWLTPAAFGQQFGVADSDVQKITDWLSKNGFTGIKVAPGQMFIEFSGTAGLVRSAFHTEIHNFMVKGTSHMANVSVPQIPAALAPVIGGIDGLHNFYKKSFYHLSETAARAKAEGTLKPGYTATPCATVVAGTCFAMGPADFAKIYNIPSNLDGTGQSIALVARSNINLQDITDYRTGFGLAGSFTSTNIVLNGTDPGIQQGDDIEATLDVEASTAVAPKANIMLVVSATSLTLGADGVDLSAVYIVTNNLAPVMSESFGTCEALANNQLDFFLWEQAASQGITVMVSTGDHGSAGCDPDLDPLASTDGLNISGTASTPFDVAVGGTDFDDATNQSMYWAATNGTGLLSAKSYIPEITWNDSCAAAGSLTGCTSPLNTHADDLAGGSGGQSTCGNQDNLGNCLSGYAKPAWQSGVGVPADGVRDIPDVSLFASDGNEHSSGNFWILCYAGTATTSFQAGAQCNLTTAPYNFNGVGGTSASSPAFAGIMALINQKTGSRQGNANYVLYPLAAKQATAPGNAACNSNGGAGFPGATCTFNDVTKGNNSVACDGTAPNCSSQTAGGIGVLVEPSSPAPFSATTPAWKTTTGYDLATGLGSVNVTNLANNWGSVTFTATTTTIASPASGTTITHGANQSFTINVTPTTASGDVSIIASPPGSPQVAISTLTVPTNTTLTNGTATFTTNLLPGGTSYPIIARYAGDGINGASDSAPITITVNKEPSKVAATLQIEDPSTGIASVASTTPYGNNYLVRVDVTNAAGTQCSANLFAIPCPTGTITLTDGGNPSNTFVHTGGANTDTALLNNQGFAEDLFQNTNGLTGGSHSLSASYAGDNSYTSSTQTTPDAVTITPAGIFESSLTANGSTTTSVSTGQAVTLVATFVGGNIIPTTQGGAIPVGSNGAGPTGSITFKNGATTIATVPATSSSFQATGAASATASTSTTFTTTGTQTITATFATADGNYVSCTANSNAQPPCVVPSASVTVTSNVGPAAKLAFTTQPSNVAVGASITPSIQVSVEDASGNLVTSPANSVTIAILNNAGPGGVLSGTLTVTSVNGIATFPGLSINKAGTGYTMMATSGTLTAATSSAFNVTATPTFTVTYPAQPTVLSSSNGTAVPTIVTVTPSNGFTGAVMVTAGTLPSGVTCPNSPLTITVTAGAATGSLSCQVTTTSSSMSASNAPLDRVLQAGKTPTAPGANGWWAVSAGTGFAAIFLIFLPGGRKRFRAALGLGLACLLSFSLGCSNNGSPVVQKTMTTTKMTVSADKVMSGTAFTFMVAVTGGTPTGMVQLFDGSTAIGTAAAVTGGMATPTAPALSVGTHMISAHYLGDSTTNTSASGTLNLTSTGSTTIVITTTPTATPAASPLNITIN